MTETEEGRIVALLESLRADINSRLDGIERATRDVANDQASARIDISALRTRVDRIERDLVAIERDIADTSSAARRSVSESDLKHEADIAAAITQSKRVEEALEAVRMEAALREAALADSLSEIKRKQDERIVDERERAQVTERLVRWNNNPWLRSIATLIGTAAAAYFAARAQAPSPPHAVDSLIAP